MTRKRRKASKARREFHAVLGPGKPYPKDVRAAEVEDPFGFTEKVVKHTACPFCGKAEITEYLQSAIRAGRSYRTLGYFCWGCNSRFDAVEKPKRVVEDGELSWT